MPSNEKLIKKAILEKYTFKPYSKDYSKIFAAQSRAIKKALKGINGFSIEHVGSTSINGLGGKGAVDILVFVPKKELHKAKKLLIKAAFTYHGDWRNRRHFLSKYYVQKNRARMVHIHLTAETKELQKLLALVKYLKNHKKERKEYELLKKKASKLHWQDGEKYRKFKKKSLSKLAKMAMKEYKTQSD